METPRLIACVVSVLFGIAIAVWLAPMLIADTRIGIYSSKWPMTTGTVVEHRDSYFATNRGGPLYLPMVTYTYVVSGHVYVGSQVFCDCGNWQSSRASLKKFPKGVGTSVFYDPADPSLSVIEPHTFDSQFFVKWGLEVAFVVLFVIVFPVVLWILGSNKTPQRRPAGSGSPLG